jgi:hypothetical protein
MRATIAHLFVISAIMVQSCSSPNQVAGGSTSTDNARVCATVVYPNGKPAAHAVVRLRQAGYLADTVTALEKTAASHYDALTDDSGRFVIDSLDTGEYLIEAADANGNAVAIACTAIVDSAVNAGRKTLEPMGTIAGSMGGPFVRGFARIHGLERCVRADSAGRFVVDVPAGQAYRVNILTGDTAADISVPQPVQPSQGTPVNADLGKYRTDSLAIRAFLDSMGFSAVPVDSVSPFDSGTGRIRKLDLSHRGLTAVPPSVGDLTFLWTLIVSVNPITDLPSTLDRIPLLAALDISSTPIATLPAVVTRCVYLQWLFLSTTGIRDLPPEIAQLTILHELWMEQDSLTTAPAAAFTIRSLKSLSFAQNRLTQLPAAIGNLDSLEYLHVDRNQLASLPQELTALAHLKDIYAYQNNLTALPDSIGKMAALSLIDVQSNRIASLPASIGRCVDLSYLHLWNNLLTTLPDSIVNLKPVDLLMLGSNHLCTLSAPLITWANQYAESTWLADQTCP